MRTKSAVERWMDALKEYYKSKYSYNGYMYTHGEEWLGGPTKINGLR